MAGLLHAHGCMACGFSMEYCLQLPWESFQADVHDLFHDKLSRYPAQSLWRTNSPTHFGGATGTFTAIEEVKVQLLIKCRGFVLVYPAEVMPASACKPSWRGRYLGPSEECIRHLICFGIVLACLLLRSLTHSNPCMGACIIMLTPFLKWLLVHTATCTMCCMQ